MNEEKMYLVTWRVAQVGINNENGRNIVLASYPKEAIIKQQRMIADNKQTGYDFNSFELDELFKDCGIKVEFPKAEIKNKAELKPKLEEKEETKQDNDILKF
jgi:hypothetical protein